MNPQSAAMPSAPKVVNDVAAPAPAPAPAADVTPVTSGPNIVSNIPVHAAAPPAPANEDEELDKIMHDVGQELKKEEGKPTKHGMLGFLHHDPKPLVKVNNQAAKPQVPAAAVPAVQPAAMAAPIAQAAPVQPAALAPTAQTAAPAAAKPKAPRSLPVFVIFVTVLATGFLIAAAIAAYRQNS